MYKNRKYVVPDNQRLTYIAAFLSEKRDVTFALHLCYTKPNFEHHSNQKCYIAPL